LRRFVLFVLAAMLGVAVAAGQSLSQPADQKFSYTEKSPVADTPACPAAGATFVDQSPTGQTQVNGVWTLTIQSSSYGSTPFYSVTVKSGSQAGMDVVFSADGRTATLTSTQEISHFNVVLCTAAQSPPPPPPPPPAEPPPPPPPPPPAEPPPPPPPVEPPPPPPPVEPPPPPPAEPPPPPPPPGGGAAGQPPPPPAAPAAGELPFTGLPVWLPLLAGAVLIASGLLLMRRRRTDG
jgi:hypothetical protein